jgi:hypothetical protein
MGLSYRDGTIPCPAFDDAETLHSPKTTREDLYSVRVRITRPSKDKIFALFEVPAKGKEEAMFKVLRLFASETMGNGEGVKILEVQKH